MGVPIVIISYNNWKYVDNTIKQLLKINNDLEKDLIILDNKSNCKETINFLQNTNIKVIFNDENRGPWITHWQNPHIYATLPDKYIITDPDLKYNENTPSNFVDILSELSDKYKCEKIGLALDISEPDKIFQTKNFMEGRIYTIYEWEKHLAWSNRFAEEENYEIYSACIDTTFCLFNKKYYGGQYRVAGNFLAKHLPWYIENELLNVFENYELNSKTTSISSIAKSIIDYTNENYKKITKNDTYLFIKNDAADPNLDFWENLYPSWEKDTFDILDKYLDPSKVFIEIGAWIGTTSIYASRKSKYVYSVEADVESFKFLERNCKNNCRDYTLINNAVSSIDNTDIIFRKNKLSYSSRLNNGTSQISKDNDVNTDTSNIKTITIKTIIEKYNIDCNNISIIKVDIEGGEELILEELFDMSNKYNFRLYISFYHSLWKNKDLDRFTFLNDEIKNNIRDNAFISILVS